MTIEEIQQRVQELYNIPLQEFTDANVAQLNDLEVAANSMGYSRAEDDTIQHIRFVPKQQ